MNSPVIIVAQATAKPGKSEELGNALLELVRATRLQDGVLVYDLHRSAQSSNHWLVYEQYASAEAFDAHMASEPLQNFLSMVPELVDGEVEIRPYTLAVEPSPRG